MVLHVKTAQIEIVRFSLKANYNFLKAEWLRLPNSEEYRTGMSLICEEILTNTVWYVLVDVRKLGMPNVADQVWSTGLVKNALYRSEVKRIATIMAGDIFQQNMIQKMSVQTRREYNLPYDSEFFLTESEAMEWLLDTF
ncbi:hypothetical protein [Pontibacter sp. SGAir0037]|uniref:hypothetical protein n=1 Tax=Pontibacter sp. SGAir0037 TaxID=2571030 RepID=UPI0010CD4A77|nr:hypothetical protein [Pontibacter sp. SGAir0037]QCR21335.1 hypothetical protein C1N53_02555 [Pontibacter sp. SGAir0037]